MAEYGFYEGKDFNMTVYTFQEACDYLRVKRNTMYTLIDSGKLKGFRIGKLRRFTDEELDGFIRLQMQENSDADIGIGK